MVMPSSTGGVGGAGSELSPAQENRIIKENVQSTAKILFVMLIEYIALSFIVWVQNFSDENQSTIILDDNVLDL